MRDGAIVGGGIALVVALVALMVWAEHVSLADYRRRCLESGMSAQQCDIMVEAKASADAASAAAGFAIGFSSGKR